MLLQVVSVSILFLTVVNGLNPWESVGCSKYEYKSNLGSFQTKTFITQLNLPTRTPIQKYYDGKSELRLVKMAEGFELSQCRHACAIFHHKDKGYLGAFVTYVGTNYIPEHGFNVDAVLNFSEPGSDDLELYKSGMEGNEANIKWFNVDEYIATHPSSASSTTQPSATSSSNLTKSVERNEAKCFPFFKKGKRLTTPN